MSYYRKKPCHGDLVNEYDSRPYKTKRTFVDVFKIPKMSYVKDLPDKGNIEIGPVIYAKEDFIRRKIFVNGKETFYDFKNTKYYKAK